MSHDLGHVLLARSQDTKTYYAYEPSTVAALVVFCTFAVLFIGLAVQAWRYRVRYTNIILTGAATMSLGYLFRAISASGGRQGNSTWYLLMQIFIILSPLAYMAGLYVIYGRLVRRLTTVASTNHDTMNSPKPTKFSPLPPHLYARVFVVCDVVSFFLQAGGAGLLVSDSVSTAKLGKNVLLFGLGFGLLSFGLFVFMTLYTASKVRRTIARGDFCAIGLVNHWQNIMVPIYVGESCLLVRTAYRLIEFTQGTSGQIYTTEWYLYAFDAAFMAITVAIWIPFYPAKYGLDQSLTGPVQTDSLAQQEISCGNNVDLEDIKFQHR